MYNYKHSLLVVIYKRYTQLHIKSVAYYNSGFHFISASNEPKTYANLLKSGSNIIPYGNSPTSQSILSGPLPLSQPRPCSPSLGTNNQGFGSRLGNTTNINNRGSSAGGPGGLRMNQQQPARLPSRQDSVRSSIGGGRNSINEDGGSWGK